MISVPTLFNDLAKGQVIELVSRFYVSFSKTLNPDLSFFTLNQSELDGGDILEPYGGGVLQLWDAYAYTDYSDRIVSIDLERSIEYPYNTQMAMADIVLDNYDKLFDVLSTDPFAADNLPGRPVKLYLGFGGYGVVPQFVGLTKGLPSCDMNNGVATYHAVDFLSEIASQNLVDIIDMRNVRTDEVLEAIVQQFGLTSYQYDFEPGKNIIPFVFFDIGENAGDAMQKLVQAENGKLWLDETGMLRFTKRDAGVSVQSYNMDDYQMVSAQVMGDSGIVNHIIISCDLREVQEYQTVYSKTPKNDLGSVDLSWTVVKNSALTRNLSLEDPCYSIVAPTLGRASSVSWFTAIKDDGTPVTSGVSISGQLTNNAYIITITNANNFDIEIDGLVLWGEPAKVYNHLDYEAYDDVSVEKYGDYRLTISDNKFFQSYDQAVEYADSILRERANPAKRLQMQIKGDFSLQLGDVIQKTGEFAGRWQIDSIRYHLEAGSLETTLETHKVELREWFILDSSKLDSIYVLG